MTDGRRDRRWTRIFRPDPRAEVEEELAFHLEQRVNDYVARGMDAEEARAAALARLGGLDAVQRECAKLLTAERRTEARRDWLRLSWLDFKLGFRMLVRYPGLSLVGGLAMAFAIWVGAGTFEFVSQVVYPKLPLPEGDRIVALRLWHAGASQVETQASHDLRFWREELGSVEDLGAYRMYQRNLIPGDGRGEPVEVTEISASAFRVARVPPALGRPLMDADEQPGAPGVVVIGHDVWQSRFGGDPGVVGQVVRLGGSQASIVGVMPEGFAFPRAQNLWVPLPSNALEQGRREGPGIRVFGRLADGVTLDQAQAELTHLGRRLTSAFPDTHEHIRPQVMPYAQSFNVAGLSSAWLLTGNLPLVLLLVLVCGNVALLMFARAATRESEIVVRNALGASRGRILMQLFTEALVLGLVAAALGLAAASYGLGWGMRMVEGELLDGARFPFWFHDSLSPATVLYALGLTVLGAAVAGVVPALKVMRSIGPRLKQATAGGGGLRFGGVWTAVIVAQVAITVTFPAIAYHAWRTTAQLRAYDLGFAPEEYLSVRLEMDRESSAGIPGDTSRAAFIARFGERYRELDQRLIADPAVLGVTFADVLPRMYHGWNLIDVAGAAVVPRDSARGHRVSAATVDADYFETLDAPILAGRGFHSGDLASGARVVIVNQPFVDRILAGRNPIGQRVRYLAGESERAHTTREEWYEIVGVVRDLGMTDAGLGAGRPGMYHPMLSGSAYSIHMAVHVRGNPEVFIPRLREVATEVDPALQLHELTLLDHVIEADLRFVGFWLRLTLLVSSVALLLALGGIYAVMAFTVSQRTREIGIRVALGSHPREVLLAVFRRPLAQVGAGLLAGGALVLALTYALHGGALSGAQIGLIAAYSVMMTAVCALACIVPTHRALRVQPMEALRADG